MHAQVFEISSIHLKILGSREVDMQQVPHWALTNIWRNRKKNVVAMANLDAGISAPLR